MRTVLIFMLNMLYIVYFATSGFGAAIVAPKEEEVVEAGAIISVIVKPDPGENWQAFIIGFDKVLAFDQITGLYKTAIQVPKDVIGYRDDLAVTGLDYNGKATNFKRRVFVKLPPDVIMKGIVAGYSGNDFMTLKQMPPGSSASDIERYGTRQITTHGQYSDGVNRILTSSASGTIYTSSDVKVATVSPEGKVTAQGLGKAKIIVRNGKFSSTVDVLVKPYKK